MANFQVHLPNYMLNTWNQLTSDGEYSRQDHQVLKGAAEQHRGRIMQEAFESSALHKLEEELGGRNSVNLSQAVISSTAGEHGSATLSISMVDRPTPTQAPAPASAVPALPSEQERLWVLALEKQVAQTRQAPSEQDQLRLQNIMQRLHAHLSTQPPPSEDEVAWANDLKQRVQTQGFEPNDADKLRFQNISLRFALQQERVMAARLEQVEDLGRPITQREADWARQIQVQQQQGQPIAERELERFLQILKSAQKYGVEN